MTGCGSIHLPSSAISPSGNPTPQQAAVPLPASPARVASGPRVETPCPTPQAPASFPVATTSTRNLVIAHLNGSDQTVIRDVTDINNPSTVATLGSVGGWQSDGWQSPSFISPTVISYVNNGRELVRSSLSGQAVVVAATCAPFSIPAYAWSRDGEKFTYVVDPQLTQDAFQWHLVSAGVDRILGTAPLWCYCGNGSEDDSLDVRFSADGQLVSLIDGFWTGTALQVRRLDGTLVGNEIRGGRNPSNLVTMGIWSGTDFFYRDARGVERWHDGNATLFLSGVTWLHPRSSPNGDQIVYAARGSDGLAHITVVNTTTGQARQVQGHAANAPMFLSSRYLWYRGERLCGANEPGICIKATFTGKTYIYDLQTGIEWESIITDIADVWPHGI